MDYNKTNKKRNGEDTEVKREANWGSPSSSFL